MLGIQRNHEILSYMERLDAAKVAELASALGVSQSTIRRDLDRLESEGLIRRVHGGATIAREASEARVLSNEAPAGQRTLLASEDKRRIGAAAAGLVQDNETILITSGTTTEAMLPFLQDKRNLTVITNALNVASKLSAYPQIAVVVLGGWLRHSEFSLLGHLAEQALQDLRADRLFHGVYGVHVDHGLTGTYVPEVQTDRVIVAAARELIVLADHTKFGRIGSVRLAPIEAVATIITDTQVPAAEVEVMRARGITILQV